MNINKLLLVVLLTICVQSVFSQIGEVKISGNYAKIYDEEARYSNKCIYLGTTKEYLGNNYEYVIIKSGNYAQIYNSNGQYTNKCIYLGTTKRFVNVNSKYILLKDGNYTKYYNFNGQYTNKCTYNSN